MNSAGDEISESFRDVIGMYTRAKSGWNGFYLPQESERYLIPENARRILRSEIERRLEPFQTERIALGFRQSDR